MDLTSTVKKAQPIKCEHFNFKAETMQHMKTHVKCKHQGFKCDHCEYNNISKDILRKHMQKQHQNQSIQKNETSSFTCTYCGEAYENKLKNHIH